MRQNSSQSVETQLVKNIQFGIYSEQDILKQSVCEVNSILIYNQETSLPAENGLNDPRMGVTMRGLSCQTCFGDLKSCPGHFGHMKLSEIVYHPKFIESVYKILKSICYNCSKLLISPDKLPQILQISKGARLNEISKIRSNICGSELSAGCDCKQPKYRLRKMDILIKNDGKKQEISDEDSKRIFRASEVYQIFKDVSDETIEILGLSPKFSRPEFMLVKLLIVVPPIVRPSIELSSSARSEDDISHLYQSILSCNLELKREKEAGQPQTRLNEIIARLQSYVSYLIDNDEGKAKQKGGRPVKAFTQRLKGKEGRLRGNLMGKRVDFSSRTVVSPDPSLELDQLGVPLEIAKELTIPVKVTQLNIEFLKKLVDRGDNWPGARYYFSKAHNNEISDLNYVKCTPNLQYGDVIERHLMDDDYVVFNRQPSLHKMSLMGHRVKVLPGLTFRLNLAVTTPYNADFDGDEMNMHVPQNLETSSEVKHIMSVPKQIISPQSNRPVMGLNQDSLLGIRLFTLKDVFLTKDHLYDLLMTLSNWDGVLPQPAIVFPQKLWTGKQILSFIIPKINYLRIGDDQNNFYNKDDSIIIKKGEHLVGTMNKNIVGPQRGSLIGSIWIDYGPDQTKNFLTLSQQLIIHWMLSFGWTVGIADTIIPVKLMKIIDEKRMDAKKEFHKVLQETQKEKKTLIIHQPGKTIVQSFEHKVNTLLNDCRAQIGKLLNDKIGIENHIKNMIISGSKGNNINISQITGLVGQQNVEGARIPFGFKNRTLPHFLQNDFGPESRGFVANSYYKGLTPVEFYFHTMGGREGLIDTAVKTSQTGYIQRRLVKALEDVMVNYDYSVRDSSGNIVQYLYGEDGIAAEFIEDQKFNLIEQGDEELRKKCLFFQYNEKLDDKGFEDSIRNYCEMKKITFDVQEELLGNKEAHALLVDEYEQIKQGRDTMREIFLPGHRMGILPVNIERLVTQSQFKSESIKHSDLSPFEVIDKLNVMLENIHVVHIEKNDPEQQKFSKTVNDRALFVFRNFLRYNLCSKKVILEYKLSKRSFKYLLNEIENCFIKSRVNPGEMAGSISAQSLGETLTQMTLNTFHFAGVSSQNITLGVPRIQEIINVSKNIKGPSMTIYLKEDLRYDKEKANKMISTLEFTTIGHLAKESEIYFDPKLNETVVKEDEDLLFLEEEHEQYSPLVLRLQLDPIMLVRKGITLKEITKRIEHYFPRNLQIIESLESKDPIILRIRLLNRTKYDYFDIKKIEQFLLNEMSIKGFCKKVSYRQKKLEVFTDKGIEFEGTKEGEYILETSGTDIRRVLNLPGIDTERTTSNHILDIYQNFGIEAARISIMNEINIVFVYFNIYVNYRHISLLAEAICAQGKMMAISRNGINRVYSSPFRKCSFEETVDILIKAAVYSVKEPLRGVTENVMMGQLCKIGTGSFDILMDTAYLLPKEEEREKITAQFRYFPDPKPPLEIEREFEEEINTTSFQTPLPILRTPGLHQGDFARTPIHTQIPVQTPMNFNYHTPVVTPMAGISGGMFAHQRHQSPVTQQGLLYSPGWQKQNDYQNILSPLVPKQTQSPYYQRNMMGREMMPNTGNELKFSPITPHYGTNRIQSPHQLQSPRKFQQGNSTKHLGNMSPSYQYDQNVYSPVSNDIQSHQSSSRMKTDYMESGNDNEIMNQIYGGTQSPTHDLNVNLNENDDFSEKEEDDIKLEK